jgi:hypothetical protein
VAVDSAGNVYVADEINDDIRKITPSGVVTTLAGSDGQAGSTDGALGTARFHYPMRLALDSVGDVYVADSANYEIREIIPSGVVVTLAGSPGQDGSSNGVGSAASFSFPEGVAVDSAGNVYVAGNFNCEIRLVKGTVAPVSGDMAAFSEAFGNRFGERRQRRQQLHGDLSCQHVRVDRRTGNHRHCNEQHQGLRRHRIRDGHADRHHRQPGRGRRGSLHRDLHQQERRYEQDAHPHRFRQRQQ